MENPKLTPAQQAIADKMAKGAELVDPVYGKIRLRAGDSVTILNVTNQVSLLLKKGVVHKLPPVPDSFETVYTLTPLGLSLARKDGENGN